MKQTNETILFQENQVRRVWHNDQWSFSIVDVIEVLTDSPQPSRCWHEYH